MNSAQTILKKIKTEDRVSYVILTLMIIVYIIVFTYIPWKQQDAFATFGYDLGYVDNRIWLVNEFLLGRIRFDELFSTIGGMHIFGNHIEPILFLLAPFYWIWDNVKIILLLQTSVIALGALPVYWIGKDKLNETFTPLVFPFAYLMYPALQYITLWHFHSEALAITFLLFAFYYATKNNYLRLFLFSILAIMTKEDMTLVTLFLGGYVFIKQNKKFGTLLMILSIVWFVVSIKMILPYYSGEDSGFIFQTRYGSFGNSFDQAVKTAILNPSLTIATFMKHEGPRYATELLAPTTFVSLLNLDTLAIALPTFAENVFSAHPLQQTIRYQYNAAIIPFIFISLIYGYSKIIKFRPKLKKILLMLIISTVFATNIAMSPSPISSQPAYYLIPSFTDDLNYAISLIPSDARVSAHYSYVPHLSHRRFIYEFPNPFKCSYWGAHCENTHDPATIEYVILDKSVIPTDWREIVTSITSQNYEKLYETSNILLLKKI